MAYLKNASSEQLMQDWEDLKEFNNIGPEVQIFTEQLDSNHIYEVIPDNVTYSKIKDPGFSLDLLFLAS